MALHRWFAIAVVAAELAACSGTERPAPAGPSFDVTTDPVVTGSVLGPAGSICNSLSPNAVLIMRLISVARNALAGSQNLVCPTNSYTFASVQPGSYLLRVQLPINDLIAAGFPWRVYSTTPVEVGDAPVTRDLPVEQGLPLGGGVFVDGVGIAGIPLTLFHADVPAFGVAQGASGADGRWDEFFGRTPIVLQSGIRMVSSVVCDLLGARLLSQPSFDPFVFPDDASSLSCELTAAEARQFTHQRTRLVVTPGPGDVGAGQLALPEELGDGWGVQFPVTPGEQPRIGDITVSQLFLGGLIIGIRPNRILSANELNGYIQCGNCRAFGPDGRLHFTSSPQFGKKVTWQYSDASSPQGVGLKVVQKSYDGVPPADYVLFRFTLTNGGAAPVTIYPGFFADWDIDDVFFDDVGATEGRLMYMTNVDGGIAAGSLIISDAPVSGTAFFTEFGQTTAEIVSALAGDFTNPSVDVPRDHRYVQSIGPITLARGASTQFWLAIVAGEGLDQLRSNAAAAAADVAARRAQPDAADAVSSAGRVWSGGTSNARSASSPACKKGCATVTQ